MKTDTIRGWTGIILTVATLLFWPLPAPAAPAVKLAAHPTSRLSAYPQLHSVRRLQGRIYFGYGNWNTYPVVVLVSYHPPTNRLILEHSVSSDAVEMMRECGDSLYVPHCDPAHYEDFHDYSYRGPDGRWLQSSALEGLHWFDFAQTSDGLFVGGDGLYRSLDEGRSWTLVNASSRCYYIGVRDNEVNTVFGRYKNGVYTAPGINANFWNHSDVFPPLGGGVGLMLGLGDRIPGLSDVVPYDTFLRSYNGSSLSTLSSNCRSFTTGNNKVHLLEGSTIRTTANPEAAAPAFEIAPVTGLPSNATCLELLDGIYYIGTANGEIWIAKADGTTTTAVAPVVENLMPDSFGRGLALHGDRLVVGAPEAGRPLFLSGLAEVWQHQSSGWVQEQVLLPPVPDFSGWMGKDAALKDDLMAVLEAGHDVSNANRGANAKIHLYQLISGTWNLRYTLALPFTHSVAFNDDLLVAGTSNPAMNQAAGIPGVKIYPLTRDGAGLVIANTTVAQLQPSSTNYGYKSVARVAVLDDLVMAGFSGDPSREAIGLVSVFRRQPSGNTFIRVQEITLVGNARFAFSIAAHDGWVAIGAPFASGTGPHSGAVYVYQKLADPLAPSPLLLRQTISAPVTQPAALRQQGEFGASLAIHSGMLLVGRPGLEIGGSRQRGAVYKYRLAPELALPWQPVGELERPVASETEFGIEVACNERWLAAGSLASTGGQTGLTPRVRLVSRSGYEDWLDRNLVNLERGPTADPDADGTAHILEYAFNLHPLMPDATSAALQAGGEPSGLPRLLPGDGHNMARLIFVRPVPDPRVTVTLEQSPDLNVWSLLVPSLRILGNGTRWQLVEASFPSQLDDLPRFWRVKAAYAVE